MDAAPLYFVRSGDTYIFGGFARSFGSSGSEYLRWARNFTGVAGGGNDSALAYRLIFSTSIENLGKANRFYAFPLRCLSTAVEGEEVTS